MSYRNNEEVHERFEICRVCEKYELYEPIANATIDRCTVNGLDLNLILTDTAHQCPLEKWK